jgi:hypothetical protein
MKTITMLFARLKAWFMLRVINRLFISKKQNGAQAVSEPVIEQPVNHYRPIPQHNNRKRTRGRAIQEIVIDSKHSRFIYH